MSNYPYDVAPKGSTTVFKSSSSFPVELPLEIQRQIMIDALVATSSYCPKDNSQVLRRNARFLVGASLVSRIWRDMIYPILYQKVCLPRFDQLLNFIQTITRFPHLGEYTTYFHYFDEVFPPKFVKLIYLLPNLKHFLSQADATQIPDEDIESDRPRPQLHTLEIDPGLHDGQGNYLNAQVERWADLSQLMSLAVVGIEAPNNLFLSSFPHLTELHLLHTEDEADPHPENHTLLLSILSKVGHQLQLLRIDESSLDILDAPVEIFEYCPHLVTLSLSGLAPGPLVRRGHRHLTNLLLGDPWSYHSDAREQDLEGRMLHHLREEDKEAAYVFLDQADKESFPSLKVLLLWNVNFDEEHNRSSKDLKDISEKAFERFGWLVADRFAHARDPSWPTAPKKVV